MRGKLLRRARSASARRITPACAGKTYDLILLDTPPTDHPRVCGENAIQNEPWVDTVGSPPRVRGKRSSAAAPAPGRRITPACAGKTHNSIQQESSSQDHPRVCGENNFSDCLIPLRKGSPPRVRGKRKQRYSFPYSHRITPACAGKTIRKNYYNFLYRDHPRVCGENFMPYHAPYFVKGSPPRVRGKHGNQRARVHT